MAQRPGQDVDRPTQGHHAAATPSRSCLLLDLPALPLRSPA